MVTCSICGKKNYAHQDHLLTHTQEEFDEYKKVWLKIEKGNDNER